MRFSEIDFVDLKNYRNHHNKSNIDRGIQYNFVII